MADDIDIEEHDVLDNPHIRTMFPDLAIVKTETLAPHEEVSDDQLSPTTPMEDEGSIRSLLRFEDDEYSNNRIIIGSKPCSEISVASKLCSMPNTSESYSVKVKQEPMDFDVSYEDITPGVIMLGKRVERDVYGAFVSLEDWADKLRTSNTFCRICETLFPTRNCLDAHNMVTHSFLVALEAKNTARKSTAKGKQCNHCSLTFQTDTDLINHLYDVANPKQDSGENIKKENPVKKVLPCSMCTWKFEKEKPFRDHMLIRHRIPNAVIKWKINDDMCSVCGKSYRNNKSYNVHVRREHYALFVSKKTSRPMPSLMKYMPVKKGDKPKTYTAQHAIDKSKSYAAQRAIDLQPKIPDTAIPKDVLYTCKTCDIFFTSCSMAISHSETCSESREQTFKCGACSKVFLDKDCTIHPLQHKISQSKFSIFVAVPNLYGKILCQCPSCNLYLHEKEFWAHYTDGCKSSYALTCNACDLQIEMSSFATHSYWHKEMHLKNDSFIKVVYESLSTVNQQQIKKETPSEPTSMYYCKKCMCVFLTHSHTKQECAQWRNRRKICRICGLMYSKENHMHLHEDKTTIASSNFNSIRFFYIRKISEEVLPMPDYPRCKRCKVCFLKPSAIRSHECDDKYKSCTYCNKKFSDLALRLHNRMHMNFEKRKFNAEVWPKESPKKEKDIMPDLLDKYMKLEVSWNILFVCSVCTVATDSYDNAVEHSQNHFSNLEHFDVVIKECLICKLNFDSKCYERHRELHAKIDVDRSTFRILLYDYSKLLLDSWFDIFKDLTTAQTDQIIATSVYKNSRNVKLTVISEGAPQSTLYKCFNCERFVDVKKISYHCTLPMCKRNSNAQLCSICNLMFTSNSCLEAHMVQHKTHGFIESRIVVFNNPEDSKFNAALAMNTPKPRKSPNKGSSPILKCKCGLHGLGLTWMKEHFKECGTKPISKANCSKCGLLFPTSVLVSHLCNHHTDNNINKYLKIHCLTNAPKKPDSEIYKCTKCNIYFMARKTFSYHLHHNHQRRTQSTCSVCRINMSKKTMKRHMYQHHKLHNYRFDDLSVIEFHEVIPNSPKKIAVPSKTPIPEPITKSIRNNPQAATKVQHKVHKVKKIVKQPTKPTSKNTLHKCPICSAHFLSRGTAAAHLENCLIRNENGGTGEVFRLTCCGLDFTQRSYMRHQTLHHKEQNLNISDLSILTISLPDVKNIEAKPADPSDSESEEPKNLLTCTLYKCHKCHCVFSNKTSLQTHYRRNLHIEDALQCDVCKLYFSPKGVITHKADHKNSYYKYTVITFDEAWMKSNPELAECVFFKCTVCNSLLINIPNLEQHYNNSTHNSKGTVCGKCNLEVTGSKEVVARHISLCPGKYRICVPKVEFLTNVSKDDLQIKANKTEKTGRLNITVVSNDIYKCDECNVHFLEEVEYNAHMKENVHDLVKRIACKSCGLHFREEELARHVHLHHEKRSFKLNDFNIITGTTVKETQDNESIASLASDDMQDERSEKRYSTSGFTTGVDSIRFTNKIYQCIKCSLCFMTEKSLENHWYTNDHKESKNVCSECGYLFTKRSHRKHMFAHHKHMKLKREDFEVVSKTYGKKSLGITLSNLADEYTPKSSETTVKETLLDNVSITSLATDDTQDSELNLSERSEKRDRTSGAYTTVDPTKLTNKIYQCIKCSITFMTERSLDYHWYQNKHSEHKTACPECGYLFTNASQIKHMSIHHKTMKLKREDFEVVSKTYERKRRIGKISSKPAYDSTPKSTGTTVKETLDNMSIASLASDDMQDSELDLSEEFEEHDSTSVRYTTVVQPTRYTNKIYQCKICSINFIRDRSLKHHCYRNKHAQFKTACPVCGYLFTKVSLTKHMFVHHKRMKLKREDFEVVLKIYERKRPIKRTLSKPADGYTTKSARATVEETLDNVSIASHATDDMQDSELELSERYEKRVGTSKRYTTRVDPTILTNKLYQCKICSINFIKDGSLEKHWYTNKHKESKNACPECGYLFTKLSQIKHMSVHHKRMKLKREDFEVVLKTYERKRLLGKTSSRPADGYTTKLTGMTVKETLDNVSIASLATDDTQDSELDLSERSEKRDSTSGKYTTRVDPTTFTNKIYQCKLCLINFINERSLEQHWYTNAHKESKNACPDCGYLFTRHSQIKHMFVHHEHMKLKREDLEVVLKTYERKRLIGKTSSKPADDNTPKAKRLRSNHMVAIDRQAMDVLETADEALETASDDVDIKIESEVIAITDNNTYEIYKCRQCKVHFLTEELLKLHVKNKAHSVIRNECNICNRLFSTTHLSEHVSLHHNTQNVIFNVVELDLNDEDEVTQSTIEASIMKAPVEKKYDIKLYKCKDCDVHFLSQNVCHKHVVNHKKFDLRDYIECKICNFQFRILCLHKHLQLHHESEFNLSNVLIEEYESNSSENGAPKIEIYCAKDKVQASSTVSTTTDKVDSTSECNEVSTSND